MLEATSDKMNSLMYISARWFYLATHVPLLLTSVATYDVNPSPFCLYRKGKQIARRTFGHVRTRFIFAPIDHANSLHTNASDLNQYEN